jgi:hypothetical protein
LSSWRLWYLTGEATAEDAKDDGVKLKDIVLSWTLPTDAKTQKPKLNIG